MAPRAKEAGQKRRSGDQAEMGGGEGKQAATAAGKAGLLMARFIRAHRHAELVPPGQKARGDPKRSRGV